MALAFAAETAPTGLVPDAKLLDKTTLPLAGGKAKFEQLAAISKRDTFEMFTEGEIRGVKSQYGDPNTKKGRKVKPTFEKPEQPKPKPKAKGV